MSIVNEKLKKLHAKKTGKKLLFVYNANAGVGKIRPMLSEIIEKLSKNHFNITIYATQAAGEAYRLVSSRGEKYDVIYCSGGDGTINEVVNGVMTLEKKPSVAYLPTGTVNDFARSLEIPVDPMSNVSNVTRNNRFASDIGSFNDRYFNYIAGFGAFTEVSYETPQKSKNVWGKLAYFADAIKHVPQLKGYSLKARADDKIFEGEYIFGMICNTKTVGGFEISDKEHRAIMNDGKFELVLIKNPKDIFEFRRILQALLTHDTDNDYIESCRCSKIEIILEEPVKWTLDGESGGKHRHVKAVCHKQAVEFFTKYSE